MMTACDWQISYDRCCDSRSTELRRKNLELTQLAEETATDLLDRWTGGVYGICPVTVRPCKEDEDTCGAGYGPSRYRPSGGEAGFTSALVGNRAAPFTPVLVDGAWLNISCGMCGTTCSCNECEGLQLPGPVHSVDSVILDGQILPPSYYRVAGDRLIAQGGLTWPTHQDLSQPETKAGTFAVRYYRGTPAPAGGRLAAGVLATEILKALCNDSSCQLPQRVTSVNRQGVGMEMAVLDDFSGLEEGKTGIWLVDSWVSSIKNVPRPSRVYSPDRIGRR